MTVYALRTSGLTVYSQCIVLPKEAEHVKIRHQLTPSRDSPESYDVTTVEWDHCHCGSLM